MSKLRHDLIHLNETNSFKGVSLETGDDPDMQGGMIATFVFKEKNANP